MDKTRNCRKCGVVLDTSNCYPSRISKSDYICKKCALQQVYSWRDANPDAFHTSAEKSCRKRGVQPYYKNRRCSAFLGIHVAENVLSRVFHNVETMPYGNHGFDFVCNRDKKIDVKSSCHNKRYTWSFAINCNTKADYFLCLAFDNRDNLTPMYMWLLPGKLVNMSSRAHVSQHTIEKWAEFRLPIDKVIACCNDMKTNELSSVGGLNGR